MKQVKNKVSAVNRAQATNGNTPFVLLVAFLIIYTGVLAWGWMRVTPGHEELYGAVGRYVNGFTRIFGSSDGLPWWTPDFMSGSSMAQFYLMLVPILSGSVFVGIFGDPGIKILMLSIIPLGSLSLWLFLRKLTGNSWTAMIGGILYALSPQLLLRLGSFEHLGAISYIFPPLILWSFLKVAEEGSWRASALLAASWSAMLLSYTKLAFMFAPVAMVFFIWLLLDRPDRRVVLVRGTVVAFFGVLLMSVVLLLPLMREYPLVAGFQFDNFAGWQQAFSMKNFISVLDRGNGVLAQMRPDFVADRGQFYIGLLTLFSVGLVFWWGRKHSAWMGTRNGVLLRLFVGLTLLSLWFSQGPFSVFTGVQEFLKASIEAPPWIAAVMWLMTIVPLFLIYAILPATPRRGWWAAVIIIVYLFVPAFVLLEKLPMYRDIRAPWGFWEVGFFVGAVAGALALHQLFSSIIESRKRVIVAVIFAVVAAWDVSAYFSYFYAHGLPAQLFTDFERSQNYLRTSLIDGRIYPLSGRYFYLRIPMLSGRGINTEASWGHFQMRGMRALHIAGNTSPMALQTYLRIAGISHVLLDKKDPYTPEQMKQLFVKGMPSGFDSEYIQVLENPETLAPAFVARDYIAMDPGAEAVMPAALETGGRINAVPIELLAEERKFPYLAGSWAANTQNIQINERYAQAPGQAFRRVPYFLPRTNPTRMVFDPSGQRDGWLVVTEAWHPDWRAYSDGLGVPIYRAFGGLMTVPLSQTEGPIEFIFSPPLWYSWCVYIAGISWVGVLGMLLVMPLPFIPRRWKDWWTAANKKMEKRKVITSALKKVVVVIPTYNEADTIGKALDIVLGIPRKVDVLVVDDGSPDGTADVVKGRSEFNKSVFILEGGGKAGLGTAYRRGFQWALEHGYEAAVEMDADLSHDPTDVPKLLEALESGAHLAVGSRYLGGISVLNWPQSRLFISTFGGFYVRTLTALPMSDPTSGFKAIRAEVLRGLNWSRVQAEGYAFQIELHHTAWKQGYTIKEVPIVFTERTEGDSKMSTAISLEAAWRVLRLAAMS